MTDFEQHDHRSLSAKRAVEILQNEHDLGLRRGAMFSLDTQFIAAIRTLKAAADAGDAEAKSTLAHWLDLLNH